MHAAAEDAFIVMPYIVSINLSPPSSQRSQARMCEQAAALVIQTLKEEELGQEDLNARFLSEYPGPEHASLPAVHSKAGMPQTHHCTPISVWSLVGLRSDTQVRACIAFSHPQQGC